MNINFYGIFLFLAVIRGRPPWLFHLIKKKKKEEKKNREMFGPFEYLIFWITTLYVYKYILNFILDSSEKNFKQTKKKILL